MITSAGRLRQVQAVNVGTAGLRPGRLLALDRQRRLLHQRGRRPAHLGPGAERDFSITFAPSLPGDSLATFRLSSTDPTRPVVDVAASGTGV